MHLQWVDWLIVAATLMVCIVPALFMAKRAGKSTASEGLNSGSTVVRGVSKD